MLKDWPEYSKATLEDFRPRNVGQENAMSAIREDPRGSYFLSGYFSRGKTHLMIAQYRFLAISGEKCILRSARDLMNELRKAETPHEPGQEKFHSPVLQAIAGQDHFHLFIDDIEKAPTRSGFREEILFDLLDTVKRKQFGLTITSNLSMQEVGDKLGENGAAAARIYSICRELVL